jgi:hypothetical protein
MIRDRHDDIINNCERSSKMKKLILALLIGIFTIGFVGLAISAPDPVSPGPAPNSGDGTPDGPGDGFPEVPGLGGAPNSGDGISDGSGF